MRHSHVKLSSDRQMSNNRTNRQTQRTRLAFLEAGFQLILEKGYDNIKVVDIVRTADYGQSTFYMHFKDKEAIVWAILEYQMDAMDQQIVNAVQGHESPMRERLAWLYIFRGVDLQRRFFLQMNGEFSRRLREWQKEKLNQRLQQQLETQFYDFGQSISPAIYARFVVGALLEVADYWLEHPEHGTPDEMADAFFKMIFRQEPPQDDGQSG